eukprot:CAMPEP_0172201960 /NCGR_PEP_ID=MMETSP1050-20130122/30338_1 /TAXON_ID=233186 /ORGANISM="Cryptomonas curvata, Strain CCAP979/52" /LENGTH=88 /DNA_ID=CAMNT_0012879761 /DNA_START=178 /DNA_END=441 /DNA_ORIENTATION=-
MRSSLPMFDGTSPLSVAPSQYAMHILTASRISPCVGLVALIYLERLKTAAPSLLLTYTNFQRLLVTAVMVAAKFLEDDVHSNSAWARL